MARKAKLKYKYKCLVCGTEVYSNTEVDHCDACGADEMKRYKANEITCPNWSDEGFVQQTKSNFKVAMLKLVATLLIAASIAAIIIALI